MATIEEVASAAGVSVATVSRVLNDSSSVREKTAEKVRNAIKELNYTPNMSARNLRKNESRVVLALAPNFSNPYYSKILTGIADAAREYDYSVFIYSTDANPKNEKKALSVLETHRADGAIFLGCHGDHKWLSKYSDRYPVVQCCEYIEELKAPSVSVDNYSAAYSTVKYLMSLGHEKVGMLSADNDYISTVLRRTGYKVALRDGGIEPKEDWYSEADRDYSFASGVLAAKKILEQENPPTALFCVSDILALSAISAANDLGIRVPEELSISGFDDVDYTKMFHPYLTTVAQPCYDMGVKSLELLMDIITGKREMAAERVLLPHNLVVRESTAEH